MARELGLLAFAQTRPGRSHNTGGQIFLFFYYFQFNLSFCSKTPLQDIAAAFSLQISEIGEPHYDDPSLALLFSQLRSKTLQAAKGTSEISGRAEFNFVLQMSRVFCRMGKRKLSKSKFRLNLIDFPKVAMY